MSAPKILPATAYALSDLAGTVQSVYLHHNAAMDAVGRARGGVVEDLVTRSQVQALELEVARLRDREARCPTLAEAEARAMLRALQEIAAIVGLPMSATPAEVVEAVGRLGELQAQRDELLAALRDCVQDTDDVICRHLEAYGETWRAERLQSLREQATRARAAIARAEGGAA